MKKLIITFTLTIATFVASSANYFVAPNGSDKAAGSIKDPFKTIQHAVNNLRKGDVCYLREGIYRENVVINKSNVTLAAYKDEYVVVSGSQLVTGWKHFKGEIYRARIGEFEPQFTQLLYKGKIQDMARYPDHDGDDMFTLEDGYAPLEVKANGEVIFDEALPGGENYWAGGYFRAVAAKAGATNPNGRVKTSSGNRIMCDDISNIWKRSSEGVQPWKAIGQGRGYIFHLNALSREGEWYAQDGYLYFWQPNGGVPAEGSVEIQTRKYTITAEGQRGVVIDGINIRLASIKLDKVNDCEVRNCSFRDVCGWLYQKGYGMSYTHSGGSFVNGTNIRLKNNYFAGSWGNLLCLFRCEGVSVDNCVFKNNGWMGFFTACMVTNSNNLTVTNSSFGSTGRFHLRSDQDNYVNIQHNEFTDCMKMCQDAGSIQFEQPGNKPAPLDMKGSVIAYNLFHDMNTLPAWSTKDTQFVVALYFEGAKNYLVHHNLFYTLTNERRDGAWLYMGPRWATIEKCYFVNNTVWNVDCRIRIWNYRKFEQYGNIKDAQFVNNIFMSGMKNEYSKPSLFDGLTFTNNIEFGQDLFNEYFNSVKSHDFELRANSKAIDAGVEFAGVTDGFKGKAPDAGCFEYGAEPWSYGAKLKAPIFKDELGGM